MTRSVRPPKAVVVGLLAAALVVSGIRPSYAFLDKTRFAAHLGVAYFAFHHWVQKPYQEGKFASGAPHRTSTIVKGGAALLFAVHEVRVAQRIAQQSNDPLLKRLDGKVGAMAALFAAAGARMKGGQFNPQDVSSLGTQTNDVGQQSAQDGAPIKDVPVTVPGT